MNELAQVVLGAIAGGLIGGGAIIGVLRHALENRLRETFATREDVNSIGSRVNGLETVAIQARDRADEATDRAAIIEERQQQHWERLVEMLRPMQTMSEQFGKLLAEVARQGEALRGQGETLRALLSDRHPR